jgi:hypothetical protein
MSSIQATGTLYFPGSLNLSRILRKRLNNQRFTIL